MKTTFKKIAILFGILTFIALPSKKAYSDTCVQTISRLLGLIVESNLNPDRPFVCDQRSIYDAIGKYIPVLGQSVNTITYQVDPANPNDTFKVTLNYSSMIYVDITKKTSAGSSTGEVSRYWDASSKTLTLDSIEVPKSVDWVPPSVLKQMNIPAVDSAKGFPTFLLGTLIALQYQKMPYGAPTTMVLNSLVNRKLESDIVILYFAWKNVNGNNNLTFAQLFQLLTTAKNFRYINSTADFAGIKITGISRIDGFRAPKMSPAAVENMIAGGDFSGITVTLTTAPK